MTPGAPARDSLSDQQAQQAGHSDAAQPVAATSLRSATPLVRAVRRDGGRNSTSDLGARSPPRRLSVVIRISNDGVVWFLTQMCARFSPQQVSHAVERGCGCARARESAVKSSIAQSTAACTGPAFGGGPARRQPVPPQGAEALAFTGQRTMNTVGGLLDGSRSHLKVLRRWPLQGNEP